MKYQVIGSLPIADVVAPNIVDLDPETTNIPALVEAGHIKPISETKKATGKTRGEGDE